MTTDVPKARGAVRAGFTLAEATLAMVILGMAAAGVLLPFADGASVQAEGLHRTLSARLANDLIERIVATPYDQIIPTWNGYAEDPGQIKDAGGNTFTDPVYANYSRDASCQTVYVAQQDDGDPPCFFTLATVRVHYRGAQTAAVRRLISK
jgi:hypothetical protein